MIPIEKKLLVGYTFIDLFAGLGTVIEKRNKFLRNLSNASLIFWRCKL